MIELNAVIDAGTNLKCWNKTIQSISRLGDRVTVEVKPSQIIISAYHSSHSVFEMVKFPKSFFRNYRYERVNSDDRRNEQAGSLLRRFNTAASNTSTAKLTGSTTFQLQTKFLTPIFRKVEKDGAKIAHVKLKLIDQADEDEEGNNMKESLGEASCMEFQVVTSNRIYKTYRISCMTTNNEPVFHAGIDHSQSPYTFGFESRVLKRLMDHMSTRADDFFVTFHPNELGLQSRSPMCKHDDEVLKRPINTEIRASYDDLEHSSVVMGIEIGVRNKDFRSFVQLGEVFQGSVLTAVFRDGEYPMTVYLRGPSLPSGVEIQAVFSCMFNKLDVEGAQEGDEEWVIRGSRHGRWMGNGVMQQQHQQQRQPAHRDETDISARTPERAASTQYATPSQKGPMTQGPVPPDDNYEMQWDEDPQEETQPALSQPHEQVGDNDEDGAKEDDDDDDDDGFGELDEAELDREIELRTQALGPTQDQSQAHGLFDS